MTMMVGADSRARGAPGAAPRAADRGAVLIVVMLVTLTILGLGVTGLWLTQGNLSVASAMNQRNQALYVAQAGVEKAREVLSTPGGPALGVRLAGSLPGSDDVPSAANPNGVGAVLFDNTDPANPPLLGVVYPPASFGRVPLDANGNPLATTMGTYTVFVRNDRADIRRAAAGTCAGGFTNNCPGNDTIVIRSVGVAADNRTTVVLEVTVGTGSGGSAGPGGGPGGGGGPELCFAGKNTCDDNSGVIQGIVFQ